MVTERFNPKYSGNRRHPPALLGYVAAMGFFDMNGAQNAYEQVYDDQRPRHEITHELLAGAAGFEAMHMYEQHRENEGITEHHELGKELLAGFATAEVDKHLENDYYHHIDREQAQQQAQQQANYLYDQQYSQYDPNFNPQYAQQQYGQPVYDPNGQPYSQYQPYGQY